MCKLKQISPTHGQRPPIPPPQKKDTRQSQTFYTYVKTKHDHSQSDYCPDNGQTFDRNSYRPCDGKYSVSLMLLCCQAERLSYDRDSASLTLR